ncbi:MAG: hypothetical protein ACOCP8_04875 [archaeon]
MSKDKKNKFVLLNFNKEKSEITLNDEEKELKQQLLEIENKLDSIDKVTKVINDEKPDSIFKTEAFDMLVSSVAITAAVYVVAEYLGVEVENIDNLL